MRSEVPSFPHRSEEQIPTHGAERLQLVLKKTSPALLFAERRDTANEQIVDKFIRQNDPVP